MCQTQFSGPIYSQVYTCTYISLKYTFFSKGMCFLSFTSVQQSYCHHYQWTFSVHELRDHTGFSFHICHTNNERRVTQHGWLKDETEMWIPCSGCGGLSVSGTLEMLASLAASPLLLKVPGVTRSSLVGKHCVHARWMVTYHGSFLRPYPD